MSRRSDAAKARGEARKAEAEGAITVDAVRRRRGWKRWRITIACAILAAAVGLIGLINSFRPPRVSLLNKSGATLEEIRLEFPEGQRAVDTLGEGESISFSLPIPPADGKPPGLVVLRIKLPGGTTSRIMSRRGGRGSHEVFTAQGLPDGSVQLAPNRGRGDGFAVDFRSLLRKFGLGK